MNVNIEMVLLGCLLIIFGPLIIKLILVAFIELVGIWDRIDKLVFKEDRTKRRRRY